MALGGVDVFAPLPGAVFASDRIKPEAGIKLVCFCTAPGHAASFFPPVAIETDFVGTSLPTMILACGIDNDPDIKHARNL